MMRPSTPCGPQGASGARPRLTIDRLSRDHHRARDVRQDWQELAMNGIESELILLAFLSAFLCGLALTFNQPLAIAVFAALTGGIGVIIRRRSR